MSGSSTNDRQSPIRVIHLIKGLGRGGAETLLPLNIHESHSQFDYSVGYFLPWKDALVPKLEEMQIPVTCFDCHSNTSIFASIPKVLAWLRRQRADLLHCHLPLSGVVGRLAGAWGGIPVVYTEHNVMERYHRLTRILNLATWRFQSGVVAVSEEVARSIGVNAGSRVPVHHIANGIDVSAWNRSEEAGIEVRQRLGIPVNAAVIGLVAVFRVQKRLDLWFETAALVAEKRSDAHFILVGDGPLRQEVEKWADRPTLKGRVHLTGLQDDVLPFLNAMDLYLMSSQFEGLPLSLLEAMASGLPVVVTAVGGIPQVVTDRAHGRIGPPGDPQAQAVHCLETLASPERLATYGQAARLRVEKSFGIGPMTRALEALYCQVLSRPLLQPEPEQSPEIA